LVDVAGFTSRALEQLTFSAKPSADDTSFYSKSQWGRWLNGQSVPPRNAIRRLTVILAAEDVGAEHLLELWARTFMPDSRVAEPPASPPAGVLVGRDTEMTLLTGLIRQAAGGLGGAVLIEGEPGIGKSSLVRAAVAIAPAAGCQVFWGTGDELGQALSLLPFLDGLRVREPSANPRRTTIARLLRGEVPASHGADIRDVLTEQLLALVAEESATRPTVMVVDDLHWADAATIALWGRLARSARRMPLLLLGMMRPVPQRDDLLALRRVVGDDARIQLTELTQTAITQLVAFLAGGEPDGSLLRITEEAAGNPLYITELVAALARGVRLIITDAGAAKLADGSAPGSLSAAIADRLDFVARPVREMLRAAALLGVDFMVSDLATVMGRSVADLIPVIDEACAAGVLEGFGEGLRFRHQLIRDALYGEMPMPVTAAWHRHAGRALAAAGAPADRVARQLLRAIGGPGDATGQLDEWMVDWLAANADPLVSQEPRVAAELLARAHAASPAGSARYGRIASRLADALYRIGDTAQAEQVANRALPYAAEPDVLVELHWTLTQCRIRAGLSDESIAALDLALASPLISARHRARLLALAARIHSHLGDVGVARQIATSALESASRAGDSWAMAWALHVLAIATAMQGQITDALPLFDRALSVTEDDLALSDLRLLLQINKAVVLGGLDQYEPAFATARQARYLADQVGTAIRLAQAHSVLGQLLFQTGRWDEAVAEAAALPDNLKEPAAACCDLGITAVIGFHRGETEAARRSLEAAFPHAKLIGHRLVASLALARSLDCEHAGALQEALTTLTSMAEVSAEEDETEELLADTVRLAVLTGDLSTARSLAAHAAALAAGSQIPHRQANTLYCYGLLDHDANRLLAAAERYDDAARPLLSAQALEAAAGEFASAGDRARARAAFTRAVDVYTSLDAVADVVRLRAEFRTHGIRRGPRQP
jgi:tetratricopeptide (TPR) repeat protein